MCIRDRTFTVEGPEDAQITLGLEEETEYEIDIAEMCIRDSLLYTIRADMKM